MVEKIRAAHLASIRDTRQHIDDLKAAIKAAGSQKEGIKQYLRHGGSADVAKAISYRATEQAMRENRQ